MAQFDSLSRVILQGEVKPLGLLNLVQLLCNSTLTGALRVYEFGLTFTLSLDRGFMVAAFSPEQEPLGAKLLRKGRIGPAQLERALELQHLAKGKGVNLPIGRILVHQKMVTEKDLEECVFDQIVETICLSLELPHPYFSFARLDAIQPTTVRAFINFQFALLEAFRIADEIRVERGGGPELGMRPDGLADAAPAVSHHTLEPMPARLEPGPVAPRSAQAAPHVGLPGSSKPVGPGRVLAAAPDTASPAVITCPTDAAVSPRPLRSGGQAFGLRQPPGRGGS